MIEFENYINNVDLSDKLGLSHIVVNKNVSYSGHIDVINKKEVKEGKAKESLAAAVLGLDNTATPLPSNPEYYNVWTDIDAQELYLNSKPTCYLILGKPGVGAYSLGEAMSKKLNCIHLCPKNMVLDEIEQKSSTGLCLEFNIRHNKVLTFDTFLKMLKIKLESPAITHRGYIITGFPLVMSGKSSKYLINTLNGEDAVMTVNELLFETICNLNKRKPKTPKEATRSPPATLSSKVELGEEEEIEEEPEPEEELPEEEQELIVALPKFLLNTCSDIIHPIKSYNNSRKTVLLQQLNELFDLKIKPDIIIYLSCPDKDLVTKKSHKYINYKNNHNIVEPFVLETPLEIRWPVRYMTSDYTSPFNSHTYNPKYSCRQPVNFEQRSVEQMCNYKNDLYPLIERKLKDFDPKNVIKVDARLTFHEIMHNVLERLHVMPIMPVVIPEPLFMEEPREDMEEFWKMIEELNVIHSGVVAFKRCASLWFNRCPVELKNRQSIRGNPKLAVTFFKYVFLTATLDNMISFCRNPRPYLKVKYLETTCRIIVMGTKCSGKTMISECLSWLFDTPIINYQSFVESERQKKYNIYAKTILSEIIATIEDARFAVWQNAELKRFANLDSWCKAQNTVLKEYIPLLVEYIIFTTKSESEESEGGSVVDEIPTFPSQNTFNILKRQLSFLPNLDDVKQCEDALSNKVMAQYAPLEIRTPIEKPKLPIIGDQDVSQGIAAYIVANDLKNEIEPTMEELMNELLQVINSIDKECQNNTNFDVMYGKYIIDDFPSDPEYWSILVEAKVLPDYTIALIENRDIDSELIEQYKSTEKIIKNPHERYLLANDPLLKTKLKTTTPKYESKVLNVKIIIEELIKSMLDNYIIEIETESLEVNPELDPWTSFIENVDKFKEDWESIKPKIEDYSKCFIEIELENKTDIQVVEAVLLKLRKSYFKPCEVNEEDGPEDLEDEDETPRDLITYNNSQNFGETGAYCPISYYDYGVLWEGKPELSVKFNNKLQHFCKEECLELFQNDPIKYQSYNKPFKASPPCRICIIGCIGSGKTTISKLLAKELGLTYIDFSEVVNELLIPKHFKKVGRRYENPFIDYIEDEEGAVEFQMDEDNENLLSDLLSNETQLRRMVFNYFEQGAPLLSSLMQKLITKLWFEDPFLNTGFILDGYPKLPADIEDMIACFCIPDLIIEFEGSSENSLKRLSTQMFRTWKMQLSVAKENARRQLEKERNDWMEFLTKNIVAKLIVDEILESISAEAPGKEISTESVIIDAHPTGSVIDASLFNTFNEMIQEFPEPVDKNKWEKANDVREKIEGRIESIYEIDDENIQALKDVLSEQKIKIVSVDGNQPLIKVSRVALSKLTNLRNRNVSFFEETYIINSDIAELLLLEGFCYLSKFNRMCPVYIFENPHAIQNIYITSKRKSQVFPVIHRCYVYFICGEESVKKFRTNPLKYVTSNNICQYKEYPLRIGVIGAPKSGKSSLSAKLAKRYGLICLSKGIAVRDVLDNKNWTELATKMLFAIRSGECINSDLVMKAVHNMTMDHRTVTNGFVFDGFPETASEAMELVSLGLYPNIIFDISADLYTLEKSSQNEIYYDMLKINPPYSRPFIENRYRKWKDSRNNVREWIYGDYQNMYVLDGNKSKWQCLQDAVNVINDFVPKVHYYLTNVQSNIVPAHVMCISNEIFEKRMSNIKNMCPLCLRNNILRHNAYPMDKKGVVQYKNKFYWICQKHMGIVLNNPHSYLTLHGIEIPELPAVINTVNMAFVYENGVCVVTYAEHLPAQKISIGTNKFAASFRGNTYLFCSEACLQKFLLKPQMYFDITVFKKSKFPPLSLKKLPNIGYLEQTVGTILTEACCSLNVIRPKYPGLSFQVSGLLHVALYLKTHNPLMDKSALNLYVKAFKIYSTRCKLLTRVALFLRSMDNPFARYPKCCSDEKIICEYESIGKPSRVSASSSRHSITMESEPTDEM